MKFLKAFAAAVCAACLAAPICVYAEDTEIEEPVEEYVDPNEPDNTVYYKCTAEDGAEIIFRFEPNENGELEYMGYEANAPEPEYEIINSRDFDCSIEEDEDYNDMIHFHGEDFYGYEDLKNWEQADNEFFIAVPFDLTIDTYFILIIYKYYNVHLDGENSTVSYFGLVFPPDGEMEIPQTEIPRTGNAGTASLLTISAAAAVITAITKKGRFYK